MNRERSLKETTTNDSWVPFSVHAN